MKKDNNQGRDIIIIDPNLPIEEKTFSLPSHELMFSLLAMFSGKAEKIPRRLLEKPYYLRTEEEQKEAEEFLYSIIETNTRVRYNDNGQEERKDQKIALVCDNCRIEAKANISDSLFARDINFREESLALYIKRTFGPEGLRHLLGLLIGLEENNRKGYFKWSVNEHLERLGYTKQPKGSFYPESKRTATAIMLIFSNLIEIQLTKKGKNKKNLKFERLFTLVRGNMDLNLQNEILNGKFIIKAEDYWYKHAFDPAGKKAPMYTKLLKKIARENHRAHPLTIYLAPLFAIFWRMQSKRTLSLGSIMDWITFDIQDHNRAYHLKDLEAELNYMKESGYIGEWKCNGTNTIPINFKEPHKCNIEFEPPEWLKEELKQIKDKRGWYITDVTPQNDIVTIEELRELIKKTGLSQRNFANKVGVTHQMIGYILRGKRNITKNTSEKIRKAFEEEENNTEDKTSTRGRKS